MSKSTLNAFAKNRAEELGFDLWNEFVVPLFFNRLALEDVRKPLLIEGGRGCGKTTLLRYLSHGTQLSPNRHLTREELPKHIGLYLRADTQYLRRFRGDWLNEDEWRRAFEHALCLMILGELICALVQLTKGAQRKTEFPGVEAIDLSCLEDFDATAKTSLKDALGYINKSKNKLAAWLNNPDELERPLLLPLKPVLLAVIDAIRAQFDFMKETDFFVFVDEYENLLPYQMETINTLLKHSEPPLIFHIAAKRNGMTTRKTIGVEQLQEPDDFRRFDVEEHLADDFELFAAELFCFRLLKKGVDIGDSPVTADMLCDIGCIDQRTNNQGYQRAVIQIVNRFLPGMTQQQIATYVFEDKTLLARLRKIIADTLHERDRSLKAEQFLRPNAPEASICSIALLNQGKNATEVLKELDEYEAGRLSKFKKGEWIHHYFVGSILYLYLPLQRPCILYSGFPAFLKLSHGNVRHFLELCHLSMQALDAEITKNNSVSYEAQAASARAASAVFVKETQGSGDHGNRLFIVVNTLGQIFRLSQTRASQSEPERTHFAITEEIPSEEALALLEECIKWSVLFSNKETKVKEDRFETVEYVLNPIYAPYFGISFNKGRKLELPAKVVNELFTGDRKELDELVKTYKKKWDITESEQMPLL